MCKVPDYQKQQLYHPGLPCLQAKSMSGHAFDRTDRQKILCNNCITIPQFF